MAFLFNFLISLALVWIPFVGQLFALAVLIPGLAIAVRRLRDAGKHWSNIFWVLVPPAGIIIYIVLLCKPSVANDGTPVV